MNLKNINWIKIYYDLVYKILVGWFVFNGISTIMDYLMPSLVFFLIYMICKRIVCRLIFLFLNELFER